MKKNWITLLILIFAAKSWACFHFQKGEPAFQEGLREVFVMKDKSTVTWILRTRLTTKGKKLPKEISWVLPLPAEPDKVEELQDTFFEYLHVDVNPFELEKKTDGEGISYGGGKGHLAAAADREIKVLKTIEVGNYKVTPIKILKDSSEEFNKWLKEHHYNSMPQNLQDLYLKKGAVFVAVTFHNEDTKDVELKPLKIVFKNDSANFPLRFTHENRAFNANFYFFSRRPEARDLWKSAEKDLEQKFGFRCDKGQTYKSLWVPIKAEIGESEGFLSYCYGDKMNAKHEFNSLKEDPDLGFL